MKTSRANRSEVLTGQELEDFLAFQKTREQTTDEGIFINDRDWET